MRRAGTVRRALLAACGLALCSPAAAAASISPLPASDYQTRHVCPAPAPGHASCLALQLLPKTAAARAHTHPLGMTRNVAVLAGRAAEGADGLRPGDLRSAYFPGEPPAAPGSEPQTIALVDAYNDPNAESDLSVYDHEFGLPACTAEDKCFKKVNQLGETGNLPSAFSLREKEEADGWALEISTDIEVAHAVCQNCHILLVEASSPAFFNLEAAEETAIGLGATEISNSWGGEEPLLESESPAFKHPDTVITAAAGDDGYLNWTAAEGTGEENYAGADYPASSPHVVAVGGTKLALTAAGARQSETVWNEDPDPAGGNEGAGGGGCSQHLPAPQWQLEVADWSSVGCGTGAEAKRAVADVAADGDPYTGVAVYDSTTYYEHGAHTVLDWIPIGGTSVASPIIASMFAIAGGAHGVAYPAKTLYSHLGLPSLYDVTAGGNGMCDDRYTEGCSGSMSPLSPFAPFDCGEAALICNAAHGYDGPTGVGAPNGLAAFEPGSEAEHAQRVEERRAAEAKRAEEELKAKEEALKAEEEAQRAEAAKRKLEEETRAAEAKQAEEEKRAAEARAAEAEKRAAEAKAAEEEERAATRQIEEELARNGSGTGSSRGGGAGSGAGTGAGRSAGGASSGSSGGSTSGSSTHASIRPGSATIVRLSHLALTARASAVIERGLPTLSQVAFAFSLSGPARVRVTLYRQIVVRGRSRWGSIPGTLTLTVGRGRDRTHLRGARALSAGRYRLTLAPAHGAARSIVFSLR